MAGKANAGRGTDLTTPQGAITPNPVRKVKIENLPASVVLEAAPNVNSPTDVIETGSPSVFINDMKVARLSDTTVAKAIISKGAATVYIGMIGDGVAEPMSKDMRDAALGEGVGDEKPDSEDEKDEESKSNSVCICEVIFSDPEDGVERFASQRNVLEVVSNYSSSSDEVHVKTINADTCDCGGMMFSYDGGAKQAIPGVITVSGWEDLRGAVESITELAKLVRGYLDRNHLASYQDRIIEIFASDDDTPVYSGRLRVYSGTETRLTVDTTNFFKGDSRISYILQQINDFLSKMLGRKFDLASGLVTGAEGGAYWARIAPPSIEFKFKGQWKEYLSSSGEENLWQTYYGCEAKLGGYLVDFACKWDLIHILLFVPYFAPARAPYYLVERKLRRFLGADEGPPFYIGFNLKAGGTASFVRGPEMIAKGGIEGFGSMSIGAYAKSGVVAADVAAVGTLSATLKSVKTDHLGLDFESKIFKFSGIRGRIKIKIKSGWVGSWGYEKSVTLVEGGGKAWPLDEYFRLI